MKLLNTINLGTVQQIRRRTRTLILHQYLPDGTELVSGDIQFDRVAVGEDGKPLPDSQPLSAGGVNFTDAQFRAIPGAKEFLTASDAKGDEWKDAQESERGNQIKQQIGALKAQLAQLEAQV